MARSKASGSTKESNMKYGKDELGKDVLLKDGHLQVMMEWEKPYMEACIEAIKPAGDVLEIGFGLGYSANCIEKHNPKSHTIIENDPTVLAEAKKWAQGRKHIKIIEGEWQEELAKLGKFDAIFFDDYAPFSQEDIQKLQQESKKCKTIIQEVERLRNSIAEEMQEYSDVKFSDTELSNFISQVFKRPNVHVENVINFLNRLESQGNITAKQHERFLKELEKQQKSQKQTGKTAAQSQLDWINRKGLIQDRFITFVEECLERHMKPGARLSSYMGSPDSKEQHPQFKERVLSRRDVDYKEKTMPVKVPENCRYFEGDKALVIIITKKS